MKISVLVKRERWVTKTDLSLIPKSIVGLAVGGIYLAFLLSGCSRDVSQPQESTAPATIPLEATSPSAYLEALKTKPTGKGFFVFDPVGSSTMSSEFTAGCARWLYLTLGSDPQLTQMPQWYQPEYVAINLERTDLRITTMEAKDAARILGLTHYALGSAEPGKLSFQIYEVSGKALGEPIVLAGDEAAITAALPQAASTMRERLGLPAGTFSPPVETSSELALAGRVPFRPNSNITEEDAEGLQKLAQKSVLGGMLYLRTDPRVEKNPEEVSRRATRLAQLAGDHPIVLSELVQFRPMMPTVSAVLKLAPQHPRNAPLAAARATIAPIRRAQVAAAEDVVRNAPSNPDSWNFLAIKLRALAEEKRQGRTADKISELEWDQLNDIYARELVVMRHATQLDPRSANNALVLAQAALTAGADEEARKALETAFTLGERRHRVSEIVSWALEMNAPKWGGSQELLEKTANRATKLSFVDLQEMVRTMGVLDRKGFSAQAVVLAKKVVAEAQKDSVANPKEPRAYEHKRLALTLLKRYPEALAAALQFVKLRPDDLYGRIALAEAYLLSGKTKEAFALAQEIVKVSPTIARPQMIVAEILVQQGQFSAAVAPARAAAQLFSNIETLTLAGYVLAQTKRYAEALPYCVRAYGLAPTDPLLAANLGEVLCRLGRVTEGRKHLKEALAQSPSASIRKDITKLLREFPEP